MSIVIKGISCLKHTKKETCKFYFQHGFVWRRVDTLDIVGSMTQHFDVKKLNQVRKFDSKA